MKSAVLGSKYPWIFLLILHIPSLSIILFMWFSSRVVYWIIVIYNLSVYSILSDCHGPVNLLTIRFCLNCRIHPVILNNFLYANLLVMLVMKWLRLLSMVAMVTITFSVVFACVSLVPTTISCFHPSSLPSILGPSYPHFLNLLFALHLLCQDGLNFLYLGRTPNPRLITSRLFSPYFGHKASMNS